MKVHGFLGPNFRIGKNRGTPIYKQKTTAKTHFQLHVTSIQVYEIANNI